MEAQLSLADKNIQRYRQLTKLYDAQAQEAEELKKLRAAQARLASASALDPLMNTLPPTGSHVSDTRDAVALASASVSDPPTNVLPPIETRFSDIPSAVNALINSVPTPRTATADAPASDQLEAQLHSGLTAVNNVHTPSPTKLSSQGIRNLDKPFNSDARVATTPFNAPAQIDTQQVQNAISGNTTDGPVGKGEPAPQPATPSSPPHPEGEVTISNKSDDASQSKEPSVGRDYQTNGISIRGSFTANPAPVGQNGDTMSNLGHSNVPAPHDIPLYHGKKWDELWKFIERLEAHFAQHFKQFTDARKVELGVRLLAPELLENWHSHIKTHGSSWTSYRRFVAYQASHHGNPSLARNALSTARQRPDQPVSQYALWLMQWEPHLPGLTNQYLMKVLHDGIFPPIRNRADKPPTDFLDFDSYAVYLQEIERKTPGRAEILNRTGFGADSQSSVPESPNKSSMRGSPKGPPTRPDTWSSAQSQTPRGRSLAERIDEPQPRKPDERQYSRSRTRTRSPPFRARSSSRRPRGRSQNSDKRAISTSGARRGRSTTPPPPPPHLAPFRGNSWSELTNVLGALKVQFQRNPAFYRNDARKIECGKCLLISPLIERWEWNKARLANVSWIEFFFFLVRLLPPGPSPNKERDFYKTLSQRANESVDKLALNMVRFSKSWNDPGHNQLRHLWDRINNSLRQKADLDFRHFNDLGKFTEYLMSVEDGPERDTVKPPTGPKKRPRAPSTNAAQGTRGRSPTRRRRRR